MYNGIPISPGVAIGPALILEPVKNDEQQSHEAIQPGVEWERFLSAVSHAQQELRELIEKVKSQIGDDEVAIFHSHLYMTRDKSLLQKVREQIYNNQLSASVALSKVLEEYKNYFAQFSDNYLQDRIGDLQDVIARIQRHLSDVSALQQIELSEPTILVAKEIFPSQTASMHSEFVAGIVTEKGSKTSHSAILARSLGIPAISAMNGIVEEIKNGDLVVLDARQGIVHINPGPETESAYRKIEREFFDLKDQIVANRDQPAVTKDGQSIQLLTNVNYAADAGLSKDVGACGIGLFRTEFFFITHSSIPDEDEQTLEYRKVIDAIPGKPVVIRLLDLGGDKSVPYFHTSIQANPFMGWRSIRMSREHPEFFRRQIRAILRAGAGQDVRILFPMVTNLVELRRLRWIVTLAKKELREAGKEHAEKVPIGILLEVPSAIECIDQLAGFADFFSIGANDLTQYLTASDRDNPLVSYLCDSFQPGVMRVLCRAIQQCKSIKAPVTVCGEIAGTLSGALALLSFGLREFSMSPVFVSQIKELVHLVSLGELQSLKTDLLRSNSSQHTRKLLKQKLNSIDPKLAMLETA